jgi:glucokinase
MILVGDIGGTNTTIAVLDQTNGRFDIRGRERYGTATLKDIQEALGRFREAHEDLWKRAELCCLSAAGPVRNGICIMTNVHFVIRQQEVEEFVGRRSFVINDFSAICYALPLLDTHENIDTVEFPHPNGATPKPHGSVRAVVGAGTGLGTGFLIQDRGHYAAHPSEGGHSDFASTERITDEFSSYLRRRFGIAPGVEQYLSGQGIANAFSFFVDSGRLANDENVRGILKLPEEERPGAIAKAAGRHDGLAEIMRLFVRIYAGYARNTALFLLPHGGLYLAGGIAAKNESWFTTDDLFMRTFETNYNDRITPLLRETPVVLIKDYDVSLYGAAHAAVSLVEG